MSFRLSASALGTLLCVVPFVAPSIAAAPAPTGQSSQHASIKANSLYKAIVQAGVLDENIAGVSLWHDYGAFGLYRISDAALNSLSADTRSKVQIDSTMDTVLFDRHPINTRAGGSQLPPQLSGMVPNGSSLQLVQFVGPIKEEWLEVVRIAGATPIQYIANNAYMVWTDANGRDLLNDLVQDGDFLQYSQPLQPALKLGASIEQRILSGNQPDGLITVEVQIYNHAGSIASRKAIAALATHVEHDWSSVLAFENITMQVRAGDLLAIAQRPDVVRIGEYSPPRLLDEKQNQILAANFNVGKTGPSAPGYISWLSGFGFSQNQNDYPIVSVVDDGVGNGTTINGAGDPTLTVSGANTVSRIAFAQNCTTDPLADGKAGHGHINSSIIAGYDNRNGFPFKDADGYLRGQGINPWGRIGNTKFFNNAGSGQYCGGSYASMIQSEQVNGAQISSNSWGNSSTSYGAGAQAYDAGVRDSNTSVAGNQQMIYIFAAGNDGPGANTVGNPGNGKNMITVGASENQRPSDESGSWTDGCGEGPTGADSAMDVIGFSSRGPAAGGRVKPEVIAPGTHIQGTASTATGYDGSGVCDRYRPGGQTTFAASSGTSHSTPAIAGVSSLYYRWLQTTHGVSAPSPALMKAYLIAHPTYLTGASGNGNLPTNNQGYGMPDMATAFDAAPRALINQSHTFNNTGETWTWNGSAVDPSKPVRIVMTYSDAPGSLGTSPQVNNLDLKATINTNTYLGNRFTGQWSTTGGTADTANNYEAIFLPAGTSGALQITITAANIAGDGVPNSGDGTDQDFALVCYNCAQTPDFTLNATPSDIQVCAPDPAVYAINVGSILGFVSPTTLSVSGNPAGTSTNFSSNPVTPPGTSTLTIGNTASATPGSYTLSIGGTVSGGTAKSVNVGLALYNAAPVAAGLTAPTNGQLNVAATPAFSWNAVAQSAGYTIEVATDAGFTNIVASASGLTAPTWTAGTALNTSTTYYWRVRADNACGTGTWSATFSFTTIAAPGDCGPGTSASVVYTYGFEAGVSGWAQPAGTNTNTWTIAASNPKSGTSHFRGTNTATISDQSLVSPVIALPTGQNPVVLKFQHVPNLENNGASACFDGGILEVSNDGGTSWTQVPNANLLVGPYVGTISSGFSNPLGGKSAWCSATTTAYRQTIADVSSYAGQSVQFRFRIGTDTSIGRPGWDVDDVMVQSCVVSATPHTVTPSVGTASGSISPNTAQTVNDGATTSFTLTPDSGYQIASVGGTCGGTLTGNSFTTAAVTADCTVIANFALAPPLTHTVTPSVGTASGSISPNTAQTVNNGATTSFTLTPDSGYQIANVGGTCGGTLSGNNYTTAAVVADCTVIANFDPVAIFKDGFEP